MEPNIISINTQHCLAIAAAFIAVIGACASLISGANSKAESLTNRIHESAKEFRRSKRSGLGDRCDQIKSQLDYYGERFLRVQSAQRWLFRTIGIFITCLAIFIFLGMWMIFFSIPDLTKYVGAAVLFWGIGVGVVVGTLFMLIAIYLHYGEVWQSFDTLAIEMKDCNADEKSVAPTSQPQPVIIACAAEPVGSHG